MQRIREDSEEWWGAYRSAFLLLVVVVAVEDAPILATLLRATFSLFMILAWLKVSLASARKLLRRNIMELRLWLRSRSEGNGTD
jgi:hypothetical protein